MSRTDLQSCEADWYNSAGRLYESARENGSKPTKKRTPALRRREFKWELLLLGFASQDDFGIAGIVALEGAEGRFALVFPPL